MNRPWMKFYPSDWRSDPCLRMCSIGARGLWMEMLAIMHEAVPRGHLLVGKSAVSPAQLASISGVPLKETNRLLRELDAAGVFSREGEIIISRRMLREEAKSASDRANGALGGNPKLTGGVNPPDKTQKLEARDQSLEEENHQTQKSHTPRAVANATRPDREGSFHEFWEAYPRRGEAANPKKPAHDRFDRLVKSGADPTEIIAGARRYAEIEHRAGRSGTEKIAQAIRWLTEERWRDYRETVALGTLKVFVREGTPDWDEWQDHLRATTGKGSPCKNGGWHFPSERPPRSAPAQVH